MQIKKGINNDPVGNMGPYLKKDKAVYRNRPGLVAVFKINPMNMFNVRLMLVIT